MKTNKGKLYFVLISIVILAFSVVLALLLEDKKPIDTEAGLTVFIIAQVVVDAIFVLTTIYLAFSKKDISQHVITYSSSLIILLLPLLLRLLVKGPKPNTILAVVILFIVLIIYLAVVLSMDVLSGKMKEVENNLAGREIKVEDVDDYNDEMGKFVGANNKKEQK